VLLLCRLPQDEVGGNDPSFSRSGALEEFADRAGDRIDVERYGGHRRAREGAPAQSTEADQGDVRGDREAAVGGGGHATERQLVARRHEPAEAQALGQRLGHRLVARVGAITLRDIPAEAVVALDATRLERLTTTLE